MGWNWANWCRVPGCNQKIKSHGSDSLTVPKNPVQRLRWAQALNMPFDQLKTNKTNYRICKQHFSPSSFEAVANTLLKSSIPLPWSVRAPDAKQPPLCSYLRDNPYPDSPLNRFVKEQFDYMTCNNPDLKYKEIMAKIDEDWLGLSDEQREYYNEEFSAESELWEKEHSDLHKEDGFCPILQPALTGSKMENAKNLKQQENNTG